MSIHNFKKGDIITRLEPSACHPAAKGMGFEEDNMRDRAYIGAALVFLGIANGCVNVERWERPSRDSDNEMGLPSFGDFMKLLSGQSGPITLPLDMWSEGWAHYVDPYKLGEMLDDKFQDFEDNENKFYSNESKEELEKQLEEALDDEDYKKAADIQQRLDNF